MGEMGEMGEARPLERPTSMSTSVPCGGLVHDLSSRAHGMKQLPRPSWTLACTSVSTTAPVSGELGGVVGCTPSSRFLKRSLRATFPGILVPANFTLTLLTDSAESERVERTERPDKDRGRRAGTCSSGGEASGDAGGVTSS